MSDLGSLWERVNCTLSSPEDKMLTSLVDVVSRLALRMGDKEAHVFICAELMHLIAARSGISLQETSEEDA